MSFYKILGWAAVFILVLVVLVAGFFLSPSTTGIAAVSKPAVVAPAAPAGNKQFY